MLGRGLVPLCTVEKQALPALAKPAMPAPIAAAASHAMRKGPARHQIGPARPSKGRSKGFWQCAARSPWRPRIFNPAIAIQARTTWEPMANRPRFAQRHLPLSAVGARPSIAPPGLRYGLRLGISDAHDGLTAGVELAGQGSDGMAF